MFDIGFSEIVVIAVVALVVIGPEKLPKTARTLGHLFGRLQRYVSDVKADINREIELDELRKLQQEVQTAAKDIESSVSSVTTEVESNVRSMEKELNTAGDTSAAEPASAHMLPLTEPPAHLASDVPSPAVPGVSTVAATAAVAPAPPHPAGPAEDRPLQGSLPGFDRG